jgi:hypothetical protein
MYKILLSLVLVPLLIFEVGCGGPSVTSSNTLDPNENPVADLRKDVEQTKDGETLAAGTLIRASFQHALTTASNAPGDNFTMKVVDSVKANDKIVIPIGSTIKGVVAEAVRSGRVKGLAYMSIRFTELVLPNGQSYPIQIANVSRRAPATKKKDGMIIGGGAGIGAAIGAIAGGGKGAAIGAASGAGAGTGVVLATRGKETGFSSGSTLNLKLTQPLKMLKA